ncbi:preprotein translocase subunit SecG [Yunchengibacter salinarum]|uniref:preprotein translocase subunit SecG n=1 Tax=Yunchengibacter salinarum TaxID=3133399 RepID=UPI0035B63E66
MQAVLLSIHLIVAIAMVALILMQRSEGGALGIGGGSGGQGGMTSARKPADVLSTTTKWLAVVFIANSLALGWLAANRDDGVGSVLEQAEEKAKENKKEEGNQLPDMPTLPEDEGGG